MKGTHDYGCWTCRLRHKKCDKIRPICGACRRLDITCHPDQPGSEWLHDDAEKADLRAAISLEVKEKSHGRRERKKAATLWRSNAGHGSAQRVISFDDDRVCNDMIEHQAAGRDDNEHKTLNHTPEGDSIPLSTLLKHSTSRYSVMVWICAHTKYQVSRHQAPADVLASEM